MRLDRHDMQNGALVEDLSQVQDIDQIEVVPTDGAYNLKSLAMVGKAESACPLLV